MLKSETTLPNDDTEINPISFFPRTLDFLLHARDLPQLLIITHKARVRKKCTPPLCLSLSVLQPAILRLITALGKAGKIRELRFKTLCLLGPFRLKVGRDGDGKFKLPKTAGYVIMSRRSGKQIGPCRNGSIHSPAQITGHGHYGM